jgi:hypothetical protein
VARAPKRPCSQLTVAGEPCRSYAVRGSDRCATHLGLSRNHSTLTPEVAERIAQVVAAGNYIGTACAAAGVARQTFYGWWKRGDPDGTDPADAGYRAFRERIERAQAEGEARLVMLIARSAAESWQAATWLLERQYPERWARISQREREDLPEPMVVPKSDDPFAEVDELADARRRRDGGT